MIFLPSFAFLKSLSSKYHKLEENEFGATMTQKSIDGLLLYVVRDPLQNDPLGRGKSLNKDERKKEVVMQKEGLFFLIFLVLFVVKKLERTNKKTRRERTIQLFSKRTKKNFFFLLVLPKKRGRGLMVL